MHADYIGAAATAGLTKPTTALWRSLSSIIMILSSQWGIAVAAKARDWQAEVKGILKAELKRRNLSYGELALKLKAVGVKENERNISNKIARGSFFGSFLSPVYARNWL